MKNNERKPSFIAAIVFPCRVKQSSSQLYRVFMHFEYFVVSSALFKDQKLRVPPLSLRLCVFSLLHPSSSILAFCGSRTKTRRRRTKGPARIHPARPPKRSKTPFEPPFLRRHRLRLCYVSVSIGRCAPAGRTFYL